MSQEIKVIGSIVFVTLLIIGGATMFLSGPSTQTLGATVANADVLVRKDSNITGKTSSKVTLVEFGDYQCPACALSAPAVEQVIHDYAGKIRIVFRNFPLPQHKNALLAAEAAEAAGAQGKYWEMNKLLYAGQADWSESEKALEIFVGYGRMLGLNTETFTKDVQSKKYAAKIQSDKNDGLAVGVNGTPTFYLNGSQLTVRPTYDNFKDYIEAELHKK